MINIQAPPPPARSPSPAVKMMGLSAFRWSSNPAPEPVARRPRSQRHYSDANAPPPIPQCATPARSPSPASEMRLSDPYLPYRWNIYTFCSSDAQPGARRLRSQGHCKDVTNAVADGHRLLQSVAHDNWSPGAAAGRMVAPPVPPPLVAVMAVDHRIQAPPSTAAHAGFLCLSQLHYF